LRVSYERRVFDLMDLIGSFAIEYFTLVSFFWVSFKLCDKYKIFQVVGNYNFELNAFLMDGSEDELEFLAHVVSAIPFEDDNLI